MSVSSSAISRCFPAYLLVNCGCCAKSSDPVGDGCGPDLEPRRNYNSVSRNLLYAALPSHTGESFQSGENESALTQRSGGKYSFRLTLWTVFYLPYNNCSESFATRDARSSSTA